MESSTCQNSTQVGHTAPAPLGRQEDPTRQDHSQRGQSHRKRIASLLEKGKVESAGIKVAPQISASSRRAASEADHLNDTKPMQVEGVMGDDLTIELLEVLELYCELLLARFGLLEQVREIDRGVSEAVIGIIHAAPRLVRAFVGQCGTPVLSLGVLSVGRTELKELHVLRDMLMAKGGRDFAIACMDNTDNCVPERITSKLIIATPPPELVGLYLYEIAKAYSIDWRPQGFPDSDQAVEGATPANAPVPTAPATPSTPSKAPLSLPPFDNAAGFPQTPPVDPSAAKGTVIVRTSLPSPGIVPPPAPQIVAPAWNSTAAAQSKNTEEDAFEALTKRFAELKKR
ncbi:BQ2448_5335 [Microbotryum intermedium]|uniref:BQ2448_5335 protein n=1 Tax=Microbotryum intermedium TaxID=269621 RepID=A0A238F783_9BASI|nr:BQ2448_5335 [Microbotryum intermedium]